MENLIVLGEIPGTHIEITFVLWIIGTVGIVLLTAAKFGRRIRLSDDGSEAAASSERQLQDAA